MVSAFGDLNGSGNQQVWVETHLSSQSQGGNYSQYYGELRYYGNGWGSWTNSTQYWGCDFGGHQPSGTFTIPQSQAGWTYTTLYTGYYNRGHDGNGYGSAFNVRGSIDTNHSSIGDGNAYTTEGAPPRIAKVPGKPPKPIFSAVSATTIDYTFTSPSDNGGSGISSYTHQSATDSGFTQNVQTWTDNGSPGQAAGLTPGTPHWIRFRANNAIGSGPYSDALAQTTLPAVPPGMTVTATPSGTGASIALTPPGGVSGVNEYIVERRDTGTTAPVTTLTSPTSPVAATGLTPGKSYDWRSAAVIGGYTSPYTGWVTVIQPNPNTSPGDYFDGDTADKPDIDYGWTGTAGNSTSQATGKGVTGWVSGGFTSGAGSVYQTTGGYAGGFSARLAFTADTTGPGAYTAGTASSPVSSLAEVESGASYVGSMYVYPSRDQRMRLAMHWHDAAGGPTGLSAAGADVLVPGGVWTRLTATGIAPANGELALLRISDVAGTGFAPFTAGEFVLMDAAMVTLSSLFDYFDGSTPDTPQFDYEWLGTAHASVSSRTTLDTTGLNDPLDDPDCADLPSPPRPPAVPADCIDEVGTWRRYWAVVDESVISDWLEVIPTITITTGRGSVEPAAPAGVNQVRIRVYENPDNLNPDTIDATTWISEQILSYIPPFTTITLDGVSERTWAEVNGGDPLPADKLVYGTGGVPATWPVLSCGVGYLLSFDAPLEALVGNIQTGLALTERMG